MPQLVLSDEERAEVEQLVEKHSPTNRPELKGLLNNLQNDKRAIIVDDYENALRETAGVALFFRQILSSSGKTDRSWKDAYANLHDFLICYDELAELRELSDALLSSIFGVGDNTIEQLLWETVPTMVRDVFSSLEDRELANA